MTKTFLSKGFMLGEAQDLWGSPDWQDRQRYNLTHNIPAVVLNDMDMNRRILLVGYWMTFGVERHMQWEVFSMKRHSHKPTPTDANKIHRRTMRHILAEAQRRGLYVWRFTSDDGTIYDIGPKHKPHDKAELYMKPTTDIANFDTAMQTDSMSFYGATSIPTRKTKTIKL